jgi:hypothetical protein
MQVALVERTAPNEREMQADEINQLKQKLDSVKEDERELAEARSENDQQNQITDGLEIRY